MNRRNKEQEIREQRSVFYFTPRGNPEGLLQATELYTNMFMQDVSQAILPSWATRRGSKADVSIAPANEEVEKKIAAALDISRQGYYHRDLARALSEFFRLTMIELCLDGRALFEIAYLRPEEGAPKNGFDLVHLKLRQMKRGWGKWYQVVPPDVAEELAVAEKIHIPDENIVTFTLPNKLSKPVSFAMEAMSAISDHRLYTLAIDAGTSRLPYDFSKHQRSMNMALGEAMREIGWMGRGTLTNQITSYYYLRQDLRFRLFALELREALLMQLNALLRKVGAELGWSAEIVITGLPERGFLDQTLDALHSGTKPFTEIMASVRNI
jgi:hypothetical protein